MKMVASTLYGKAPALIMTSILNGRRPRSQWCSYATVMCTGRCRLKFSTGTRMGSMIQWAKSRPPWTRWLERMVLRWRWGDSPLRLLLQSLHHITAIHLLCSSLYSSISYSSLYVYICYVYVCPFCDHVFDLFLRLSFHYNLYVQVTLPKNKDGGHLFAVNAAIEHHPTFTDVRWS